MTHFTLTSRALFLLLASLLFHHNLHAADILTLDVIASTPEFPRHDHQLIFPLSQGKLLLVWSEYYRTDTTKPGLVQDDMRCRISTLESTDRGRTWGNKRILQPNIGKLNVKHPNLLRLPNGEVLFCFTVWNSMQDRAVLMRRSTDDCQTWNEPRRISHTQGINNINNDHVLLLRSGRILLPTFNSGHYGSGDHWQAFALFSDDLGKTWQRSDTTIDLPKRGAEEPTMVERKDGSLLALVRTSLGTIYQSASTDQGKTWTNPSSTGLSAPASPPLVKRIPKTGDLLLVWNNNHDPNHHHQGERTPLTSAISSDEGQTWKHQKNVEQIPGGAAAYASVYFQENEALIAYYYQGRGFGGTSGIRLKIIPVDWFYQ